MNAFGSRRELGHPGFITEDASTGDPAGGIDRQDGDPVPLAGQVEAEGLDQGALAGTWHAGDAKADGIPRVGEQLGEHALGQVAVLRPPRLDQRDHPAQHAPLPVEDARDILLRGQPSA